MLSFESPLSDPFSFSEHMTRSIGHEDSNPAWRPQPAQPQVLAQAQRRNAQQLASPRTKEFARGIAKTGKATNITDSDKQADVTSHDDTVGQRLNE